MSNTAILACAGSRKTETVIDHALSTKERSLILTFTAENQKQIVHRIRERMGVVPPNVVVMGWFAFLINECAKPYQRALTGQPFKIAGLNFKGRRARYTPKTSLHFYLDSESRLYRDETADFVVQLNQASAGAVKRRLEAIYDRILIDEVQDLTGYDLDVLDMLLASRICVTLVGDPRQHTFSTNLNRRHAKFSGVGMLDWLKARRSICSIEERSESYRCNQAICDFADALYPALPRTTSRNYECTGHDGVFGVGADRVAEYVKKWSPVVLRHDRNSDTAGLPALNFGVSKGSTFDRVLIFPTAPILTYLAKRDPSRLKSPEKLYVAVTRARFSVAFVVTPISRAAMISLPVW
ncbi:UvrD-helicase domain-containing protein [Lysobacter claricitrinus]|uniref:UvrD-helicase domain-containing protein n=1 Tax=Lysobacter claricitrinus TaxID=3367728 RepID=UPI0037DB9213